MAGEVFEVPQLRELVLNKGNTWRVRQAMFSPEEFDARLGVLPEPSPTEAAAVAYTDAAIAGSGATTLDKVKHLEQLHHLDPSILKYLLNRWDWRDHGIIGPVTDQGQCGACVSFAVCGMVAAMAAKEHGTQNLHLSEAELHFCSSHGAHCGGWWPDQALQVVKDKGVVRAEVFDYESAFDDPPQWDGDLWKPHAKDVGDRTYAAWKISSYQPVDDVLGLQVRKNYLRNVGPLVASFDVYTDFNYYGGGVYRHTTGALRGGHAVLVVGYDDNEGCWIARNSWGSGFGGPAHADGTGGGYFKIAYGECRFDTNHMWGATGTQPPPNQWWKVIVDKQLYNRHLHPIDPVARQRIDITDPVHA